MNLQAIEIQSPTGQHTRREWAKRINAAWRKTLDSIFETGDELIAAKADLKHGQWEKMIEADLAFSPSTVRRLVAIASDQRLRNRSYMNVLPPSWGTLYLIHQLPDDTLEESFKAKTINPKLQQRHVRFLPDPPPEKKRHDPSTDDQPDAETIIMDGLRQIQSALASIAKHVPKEERTEFFAGLRDMIDKCEQEEES